MFAAAAMLAAACGVSGHYVWVDDLPAAQAVPPKDDQYVIGPGDLVQVRVYREEGMSGKARVRADGKISLPFLGDVEAAGVNPEVLSQQLQVRLHQFVNAPVVTVSVEEVRPLTVSVLGEVARPGIFTLEGTPGILQALAAAGGLTEFSHRDRIFVLRNLPGRNGEVHPERIRFTFAALSRVEGKAAAFRLQREDVLVVE
jgi:polysaccharide export outer membrane protein